VLRPADTPALVEELRVTVESIPHIVFTATPDGSTDYFNRQGTTYTGLPADANYGWAWLSLVHPDDAQEARRAWDHAVLTASTYESEYRIRRADGEFRWHSVRAVPFRGADGEIVRWIGTATDIDDHRHTVDQLSDARRQVAEAMALLETLKLRLRRIGAEVLAAGLLDIDGFPAAGDFPELGRLNSRQWEILSRLLRGDRVATIAAALYVSPSTVRNHLSAIFRKFGVHSQLELLHLLRRQSRHELS
jgi:PAS domain S-box-containing protein